ncbi:dehydrogenase [Escherichia coli]|nr:dehydrogenase [Escherichia coli]
MDKITQVLFSDIGKVTTQYVEVPHQELKPHEVRIAPVFYGICGSDLHVLKGGHPFAKPPVVPGHEIAARVTEVGSDVKNVQPGRSCCGRSHHGLHGMPSLQSRTF